MRLICPNCDAQYEVVDDVIPAEGRDVQCSNCGQTWFQHHPDHAPAEETAEAPDLPPDLVEPEDTPGPDEERSGPPEPAPQRRVDPSVADILRQEAERENKARTAEADRLETQPDLGLETGGTDDKGSASERESDRRAREARERMARMRGEDPDTSNEAESAATAAALGSRRDLLPDIDEINSTLRSQSDRHSGVAADPSPDESEHAPQRRRSSFGRGFLMVVLVAVILGVIYAFAPEIARAVPQVDPYLSAYVAQIDSARLWLDGQITDLLTRLDNAAGTTPAE